MSMPEYVTGELGCGLMAIWDIPYNASCHMCHNQKIVILSNLLAV